MYQHPRLRDERKWYWVELCLWHSFCFAVVLLCMESLTDEMSFRTVMITMSLYGMGVALNRVVKSVKEEMK